MGVTGKGETIKWGIGSGENIHKPNMKNQIYALIYRAQKEAYFYIIDSL